MAEILGRAKDAGTTLKGSFVQLMANGGGFSYDLPDWFVLEIPDTPMKELRGYIKGYEKAAAFSVVDHDEVNDIYRLRVTNSNASVSGSGNLVRADVEEAVIKWGGTIVSTGSNEVIFDISVYDALISQGFWEPPVASIIFTKVNFDESTGIHTISADYSAVGINGTSVETLVERMGDVIAHANGVITFTIDRAVVIDKFKAFVSSRSNQTVAYSQYYLPDGVVDAVVAAGGF